MTKEFENRVALVTGGSRGIGRSVALRLASEGSDVAISYVTRKKEADETVAEIEALGRRAVAAPCNVAEPAEVDALVKKTRADLGPIDFLAHCGAIATLADHTGLTYELWRDTIDINLNGTYLTVFAVKDEMLERGFGRMVLISSIAALLPRQHQMHYSAAKAGVIAFTRCCAEAFAPNIRVNCITPGLIDTEMMRTLSEEKIKELVGLTPLQRIGEPEELAALVRFLLSNESSFTTGQTVVASGGRAMM